MIYFNIVIIIATAVLAILSRKHYSKYKDGKGTKAYLKALGLAMGHSVWTFLGNVMPLDGLKNRIKEQLRKSKIVSEKSLELLTDRFIARCLGMGLGILFASSIIELGSTVFHQFLEDEEMIIKRDEYGGDVIEEEIYCQVLGQEQLVVLQVSPVRLSEEEFYERANAVADEIREKNFNQEMVFSQDIELPLSDSEGIFDISWVSESPSIISSRGRIKTQLKEDIVEANLRMIISYYDYSAEYLFKVLLGAKEKSKVQLAVEGLEQTLVSIEQETVGEKEFILPQSIGDVEIRLKNNQGNGGRFLVLGVFFAIGAIGISISRLKETVQKRDKELVKKYPYFVDSLWLYIESGMNIRRALKEYVNALDGGESILASEIRYTLNQIDNGESEYVAYEELGTRLNLSEYVSLMRHISQNLQMGTKDLRALMETEVTIALEAKKETAKRLGEEASTKLVFPMIVLLVVVMIMIMTPAFMGF